MKWAIILLILGIWFIKFSSEEFLSKLLPDNLWFWIGLIIIIYAGYRLGLKNFKLKNLKRILK